jgi:hypothetical protein
METLKDAEQFVGILRVAGEPRLREARRRK